MCKKGGDGNSGETTFKCTFAKYDHLTNDYSNTLIASSCKSFV